MTGKEYLDIRNRQDEILSVIDDSTPDDDPRITELLSLQEDCDEFERETVHTGYTELKLDLEVKTVVRILRAAHEAGMNASDFVSMVLDEYMDSSDEFSWTTNIINTEEYNGKEFLVDIPKEALAKRGWKNGDFVRVTITEGKLTIRKLNIES